MRPAPDRCGCAPRAALISRSSSKISAARGNRKGMPPLRYERTVQVKVLPLDKADGIFVAVARPKFQAHDWVNVPHRDEVKLDDSR